jgi:hypothetical protein
MHSFSLASRGNHDDASNSTSDSKPICPSEDTSGPAIIPFVGSLTYHQFSIILSGSCALLSTLMIGTFIATHAFNYSNRVQQRQIIRIALLIPWVALFSFLIVWLDSIGQYLVESLDAGCAIALSAFLLLMCDFVLSHPGGFDDLFGQGAESKGTLNGQSPLRLRVRYVSLYYISLTNLSCSAFGTAYSSLFQSASSSGPQPQSLLPLGLIASNPIALTSPISISVFGKLSLQLSPL